MKSNCGDMPLVLCVWNRIWGAFESSSSECARGESKQIGDGWILINIKQAILFNECLVKRSASANFTRGTRITLLLLLFKMRMRMTLKWKVKGVNCVL